MNFFSVMRSLAFKVGGIGIVATMFLILYITNVNIGCNRDCSLVGLAFAPAFALGFLVAGLLLIIFIVSISIFLVRRSKNFSDGDKVQMKREMKYISLIVFISIAIVASELFFSGLIFKLVKEIIR